MVVGVFFFAFFFFGVCVFLLSIHCLKAELGLSFPTKGNLVWGGTGGNWFYVAQL